MIPSRGLSLTIFVEGGDLEGLRLLERNGWSGSGVVCPRSLFRRARSRHEFAKPAVYILHGPANHGYHPTRIYIGECDCANSRIGRHIREKQFWTELILFCAKDETLNKAHFRYLEARLLKLALDAQKVELENDNKPAGPKLSKIHSGEADAFLEEMLLFFSCIGIHAFEPHSGQKIRNRRVDEGEAKPIIRNKTSKRAPVEGKRPKRFLLKSSRVRAWGFPTADGFLVEKSSQAVPSIVPSAQEYVRKLRLSLFSEGKFAARGKMWELTADHTFGSATTAAAVLLGRSVNGRIRWRDGLGRSLRQEQDARAGLESKFYRWN
jgi:hypothetical protein